MGRNKLFMIGMLFILTLLPGCELAVDIIATGVVIGIIATIVVIALIIWIVKKIKD